MWFARVLSESRGRGFDPRRVRGSFSRQKSQLLKTNAERTPAAPAGKLQLLSTSVARGGHSRSSGSKIATFKHKRSTRSALSQLRLYGEYTPAAPSAKSQLLVTNVVRGAVQLLSTKAPREVHSGSSGSTCVEQLAREELRRAVAQSNLDRATAQSAIAQGRHAGVIMRVTAQSNLRKASLHRVIVRVIAQRHSDRVIQRVMAQSRHERHCAESS